MRLAALLLVGQFAVLGADCAIAAAPQAVSCPELVLLGPDATDEVKRITCEIPGEFRRQVSVAQVEGWLLRYHDMAARTAADSLAALKAFDAMPGKDMGRLTREVEDGIDVSWFAEIDGSPMAFAQAHFDKSSFRITRAEKLARPRPADERELAQLRARATALAAPRLQCAKTYNTVILEDDSSPGIRVYVLSAWDESSFPTGGHAMFRVSDEGRHVQESFQQSKACLNFVAGEFRKHAPVLTDAFDESPSAIQVFLNHEIRAAFIVSTPTSGQVWKIAEGRIYSIPGDGEQAKAVRGDEDRKQP